MVAFSIFHPNELVYNQEEALQTFKKKTKFGLRHSTATGKPHFFNSHEEREAAIRKDDTPVPESSGDNNMRDYLHHKMEQTHISGILTHHYGFVVSREQMRAVLNKIDALAYEQKLSFVVVDLDGAVEGLAEERRLRGINYMPTLWLQDGPKKQFGEIFTQALQQADVDKARVSEARGARSRQMPVHLRDSLIKEAMEGPEKEFLACRGSRNALTVRRTKPLWYLCLYLYDIANKTLRRDSDEATEGIWYFKRFQSPKRSVKASVIKKASEDDYGLRFDRRALEVVVEEFKARIIEPQSDDWKAQGYVVEPVVWDV